MLEARIINGHCVVPAPNPGQLKTIFPDIQMAQANGQTWCAVPHNIDSARVLTNFGYKVPSPILDQYDWPGRYQPRWYQKETAEAFTLNSRMFCLSAMRTGKTLSALWAVDYLKKIGKVKKVLIVAPLSTLWDVWDQNIFESFPFQTFAVLHGSREKRLKLLSMDHDYYIVNHHGVKIIEEALETRPDIDMVIIDEIAVFRNSQAKTLYKPMNRVLNHQGIARGAWGLTGTPTPQAPTDAYGQVKLIKPENYSGSFTRFKSLTMTKDPFMAFKWHTKKNAAVTVASYMRPSIRFERTVCTDMEPCNLYRRAELSPEQNKHYKEFLKKAASEMNGTQVSAVHAGALVQKLAQVACGAVYDNEGNVIDLDFGPRLELLKQAIEENNEKVLVFVPFTGAIHAVVRELRKLWSVEAVYGAVSPKKRTQIFRDFRTNKDPHILVANPETMAHGLDFTTASLAVWYAPYNKTEKYQQASARLDGSGQKVKMDILHLYATAEEKRAYDVLQGNGRFQDVVLDLTKGG